MVSMFTSLLGWLPPVLQIVCVGVITLFVLSTMLNIIRFILDLIPFL